MFIKIDCNRLATNMLDRGEFASVAKEIFGGIDVNLSPGAKAAFAASVEYLNLSLIRWPGGQLAEAGMLTSKAKVSVSGADQDLWIASAATPELSDFLYDLSYNDLIHPLALKEGDGRSGLSDTVHLALANKATLELFIPLERYSDIDSSLSLSTKNELKQRLDQDINSLLERLFVTKQFGILPDKLILDVGNENLVWTTRFEGAALPSGQKYDPLAVEAGIGQYIELLAVTLSRAMTFRAANPEAKFEIAIQLPYMNNRAGVTDDPQDVFLQHLKALSPNLLAQIDVLRFHPLDMSFETAANYENWFADDLKAVKTIVEAAYAHVGKDDDLAIAASAWSTDGSENASDSSDPLYSLQAASASIAAIASFAEMGVDYAATWGVAVKYRQDVQVSHNDTSLGRMVYTPRGEVLRQMAESLPGTTLLNTGSMVDASRIGPVNMQAFVDDSKVVIFVSANDIDDRNGSDGGAPVELVTIDLTDFGSEIGYVWIETITAGKGAFGDALIWNPMVDNAGISEIGEAWASWDGTSLSFQLQQDYEIARVIVSRAAPGHSALQLLGDSRSGFGITADLLVGGSGADKIFGQTGDDTLLGGNGADHLDGGLGDDTIEIKGNGDTIIGGLGSDTVISKSTMAAAINLETGENNLNASISGVENVVGGTLNDRLTGTLDVNQIFGGAGRDSLFGLDGNDTLVGGGSGDILNGGAGSDCASYQDAKFAVFIDLLSQRTNTGDALGDVLISIESIVGSAFSDTIRGSSGSDRIHGDSGNDLLAGQGGVDFLYGGEGNDTLTGGLVGDNLFGGLGFDFASYSVSKSGVTVNLENTANNSGHALGDKFDSIEGLSGSLFSDRLSGDSNDNIILGDRGHDYLYGLTGSDSLFGGAGDDFIFGGEGSDYLTGGSGKDRFVNRIDSAVDFIIDYNSASRDALVLESPATGKTDFYTATLSGSSMGSATIIDLGVYYRPTGELLWAIQDGASLTNLYLTLSNSTYDLI